MEITSWICGLMAANTNELGFIPSTTVENRYVRLCRYVFQNDERGRPVGYLLHGAICNGKPVAISQACIDFDRRLCGYGESAFAELHRRARIVGASSIHLRCAENLPAVRFWQSLGFETLRIEHVLNARNRAIVKMVYKFDLPLLTLPLTEGR